jgi:mersacidin/lichenicidin family type 2 lantibiotic
MKGNTHMKFDVVRAWKDESYRQNLSEEEMNLLPANPAGELAESELTSVAGGGGWAGPGGLGGAAASSSSSASQAWRIIHIHSFSGSICDTAYFSVANATNTTTNILTSLLHLCVNSD